jgi:outer membrane protein assembly factor BamB
VDTNGDFAISFKSPSALGLGTYQDTITVKGCYDSACTQPVQNSPQTITVTYLVTPGPGTLTSLSPSTVQAGVAFTLTVNGSGFDASSAIDFNGNFVPTKFVSSSQLTANISASQISYASPYTVTVAPSSASSVFSNQLLLEVFALPTVTGLSPSSTVAGSAGFTLTVMGTNFEMGAVVYFGGTALPTTWVDTNQLTAAVSSAQVLNAGTAPVLVATDSAPDPLKSQPLSFTIQPMPALGLHSIDPSIVTTGGAGFVLTVLGQGFVASAKVQWNGLALPTTYISESQLQAQVPASDIAASGSAAITVQNPAGSGGTSTSSTLTISAAAPDAVAMQITPDHAGAITFQSLSLPTSSTWSTNLGGHPSYSLIAAGKVVTTVVVGDDTKLIALDQATGVIDWGPIELSGPASIAYEGGKIFVLSCPTASSAGSIQSFDIASGTLDWSTPIAANGYAGVTALNGIIYISSGPTYAISEGSGTIIWTQPAGPNQGGSSTPAVTSDGVYVSYPCLTSDFQPSNGTEIFSTSTGCVGEGMPVVANGLLYSPQETPNSGAILNASTGSVVGSYVADGTPAFSGTTGYFLQSLNGSLNAVSSSNAVLWSFSGDGKLVTSPIVVNQTVFMGSASGNVYALDAATGQQLWMANAGGAILVGYYPITGLAAGDGLLIVPAGNQVVAYTLSTNP